MMDVDVVFAVEVSLLFGSWLAVLRYDISTCELQHDHVVKVLRI